MSHAIEQEGGPLGSGSDDNAGNGQGSQEQGDMDLNLSLSLTPGGEQDLQVSSSTIAPMWPPVTPLQAMALASYLPF